MESQVLSGCRKQNPRMDTRSSIFHPKSVSDIYINISHFLDHFMMLIFAKAAYVAGKYFELTYDEIIAYGAAGFFFLGLLPHWQLIYQTKSQDHF